MPGPSFTGSGGGLFGALKEWLVADAGLFGYFGDRIWTGRAKSLAVFPILIFHPIGGTAQRDSTGMAFKNATVQVSIFAEGYDPCRNLGRDVNARLLATRYEVDGIADIRLVLQVPGDTAMQLDDARSESGADVWQCPYRYRVTIPEYVGPIV